MSPLLLRFLSTGQLGPLALGIGPLEAQALLGQPTDQSTKQNPLVLRYDALDLTFTRDKPGPLRLVQIVIAADDPARTLPVGLGGGSSGIDRPTTVEQFRLLLRDANLTPDHVPASDDGYFLMPSGVRASFRGGKLNRLTLSQREREQNRAPFLSDAREPSEEEIHRMLEEARIAARHGLSSAALVLAWSGLEATMRRVANQEGLTGRIGAQPTVLLRELYSRHRLGSPDVEFLEHARQLRTSVVHGLSRAMVSQDVAMDVIAHAERLLSSLREPNH